LNFKSYTQTDWEERKGPWWEGRRKETERERGWSYGWL
jgi:hypothetical protein